MLWKEKRTIITWGVRTHPVLCAHLHAARLQHSLCDLGLCNLGLCGLGRLLGQPWVCTREPAWASTASRFLGHSAGPVVMGWLGLLFSGRPVQCIPLPAFLAAVSLHLPHQCLGSFSPSLHSLHALQNHTVTFLIRKDGNPFGTLLGLLAPCPVGPRRQQGGLPAHSPPQACSQQHTY